MNIHTLRDEVLLSPPAALNWCFKKMVDAIIRHLPLHFLDIRDNLPPRPSFFRSALALPPTAHKKEGIGEKIGSHFWNIEAGKIGGTHPV